MPSDEVEKWDHVGVVEVGVIAGSGVGLRSVGSALTIVLEF